MYDYTFSLTLKSERNGHAHKHKRNRQHQQQGVYAVQYAPVAGKQVSAVLYTGGTLKH